MVKICGNEKEHDKIKSDVEGTSDKYARMIAGWLSKLKFVKNIPTNMSLMMGELFLVSKLIPLLDRVARNKKGKWIIKNSTRPKYVLWEFLAIAGKQDSEQTRDFVRTRRAKIIIGLSHHHTISALIDFLSNEGIEVDESLLNSEIKSLFHLGSV